MATSLNRIDFVLIAHLQATWRRAAKENVDPWLAVDREKRTFPLICLFDPTDGLYHAWLSAWRQRLWHSAGFSASLDLRQLDEVCAALARFHAIKDTLPLGQRDIGQFHTVDDLLSVVPTRVAQSRRRLESEALKAQAYQESDILFREGRWMVVRLKGFVAARFWGLGTRWCTTTTEHNYWSYAAKGEMLVFLTPHGKHQLATFSQMFRDERDDPVDMKVFRAAPTGFAELLRQYRRL
ncbi:MAG: hypothetical protein KJ944_11750 [Alphaproteobacteria bacterium]|nr:hypothetical protein [Alphaproteobacteria bacterium]MBU1560097.1 hypothetical protein [Alphaproteobacteria bacterium]MBU2303259.1 hypothetical protein [Alphaproteobacteria bacterium]MBU2366146.1 hypothetical protein [Alphaproteobacteria bacterium]